MSNKVLIVEGRSDKKKIQPMLNEDVDIICTNGTISHNLMEELMDTLIDKDVYILTDADRSGETLRKQLKREFPLATHLYIDRTYREVATTPYDQLASVLLSAQIDVKIDYIKKG